MSAAGPPDDGTPGSAGQDAAQVALRACPRAGDARGVERGAACREENGMVDLRTDGQERARQTEPGRRRVQPFLYGAVALAIVATLIWSSDRITLDSERTIYTVRCEGGAWEGLRCTGRLVAGDRYRYRASRTRNEVHFWVAGSATPSGTYTDCSVRNRGNWRCNATVGQAPSITLQMVDDQATHGPAGLTVPFHAIQKWKWWLLDAGWVKFETAWY